MIKKFLCCLLCAYGTLAIGQQEERIDFEYDALTIPEVLSRFSATLDYEVYYLDSWFTE